MPKISELPVLAGAAADDIVPIVDTSGSVTNKVTAAGLVTGGFPLIATAGTAAAFTLALPTSLTNAAGQSFNIRFHLAPDAGATIAIDGQTALALRLYDGAGALTALVAGDVAIDSIVTLTLIDDGGTLRAVVNRDRTLRKQSGGTVATTSGTAFDYINIPAGAQEIEILLDSVSLSGSDELLIQIGTSGGVVTTGYSSTSVANFAGGSGNGVSSTSGFIFRLSGAANYATGRFLISRLEPGTNVWISVHNGTGASTNAIHGAGAITLGAELDRVRITRSGTDTFDAGQLNVKWK